MHSELAAKCTMEPTVRKVFSHTVGCHGLSVIKVKNHQNVNAPMCNNITVKLCSDNALLTRTGISHHTEVKICMCSGKRGRGQCYVVDEIFCTESSISG